MFYNPHICTLFWLDSTCSRAWKLPWELVTSVLRRWKPTGSEQATGKATPAATGNKAPQSSPNLSTTLHNQLKLNPNACCWEQVKPTFIVLTDRLLGGILKDLDSLKQDTTYQSFHAWFLNPKANRSFSPILKLWLGNLHQMHWFVTGTTARLLLEVKWKPPYYKKQLLATTSSSPRH